MESLNNQLFLQFLRYQSEPVQRCFRHIEALHLLDEEAKLFFLQNYDLLKLRNFSGFEYRMTS